MARTNLREVLEAIGASPQGLGAEKDAVALLDLHLKAVQNCQHTDELLDLVIVRDGARKALETTAALRNTSMVARSHAEPLEEALKPLERLIARMEKEERDSAPKDEQGMVGLLAKELGLVQGLQHTDELADLIKASTRAKRLLALSAEVQKTSPVTRSHAESLQNALAPVDRLIAKMHKELLPKTPKSEGQVNVPKVQAQAEPSQPVNPQPPQVKSKPKLKVPYPKRPVDLKSEIPGNWKADKIVTEALFHEMLDVHSELFDGDLPTDMPGISFAVVDKLTIGTAYVKAQVWDDGGEDGPFKPETNKTHKEMAMEMAPAMVTIVPGKDPKRTVYVNAEEYQHGSMGGTGTEPNYDAVNAVMLHESHHASSKGFVNTPFFQDHTLSWKFDECVTEYFTKKVWDSKYPDKADDYFKYTNYFKSGKKGWFGEAGQRLAALAGEKVLAAAYFKGDQPSLESLHKIEKQLEQIVRTIM